MAISTINSSTTGIWERRKLFNIFIYITFFLFIVTPNALRIIKLPFLFLLLVIAASNTKIYKSQFIYFILLIAVTYIYVLVGYNKTVDFQSASTQALIIFVIFPIIWTTIGNFIFKIYSVNSILKKYIQIGLWGCLSVYMAYAAFITGYGDYVRFLIERPNVVFTGDVFAISLHVFGSLLVIVAALGHVSQLYSTRRYIFILLIYVMTSFISGRSAFILAAFIGIFFFLISNKKMIKNSFTIILGVVILIIILFLTDVQIADSITFFYKKLTSGGGVERTTQTRLLIDGTLKTYFWGAGHGVGIDYIRNLNYPWRYENLILSILYRVGIIGFLVYAYPYIYSLLCFLRLNRIRKVNMYDNFFFWGTTVFILVNVTNPYMESFEFQFPFYFAYCYFFHRYKNLMNENIDIVKIWD